IGEEAYTARHLDSLKVRFKSAQLTEPETRTAIKDFASTIVTLLRSTQLIQAEGQNHFIVGCPAAWSQEVRQQYAQLMQAAGVYPVTIIAESRAAFIHAKESYELRVSNEGLQGSVLIVDVGSSTTDFTAVHHLKEHYIDFGDSALGAGLIDRLILQRVLAQHPQQHRFQEIFQKYPQYEAMCELKCRRVKERYFANEARWHHEAVADTLKIPTPEPLLFEVELTQADMEAILAQPVAEGFNWPQAFKTALVSARQQTQHYPPELIFLTGGASRMNFIATLCQHVFPHAQVVRGKEPELAIAKGLAWCGRIDQKTQAFRQEIEAFFDSGQLPQLVEHTMPRLLAEVATVLVQAIPEYVILPTFREWQRGGLKTLIELEQAIEGRTEHWLLSAEAKSILIPAVEAWFTNISPQIEQALNPICDRYHIPRTAFNLFSAGEWHGQLPADLVTDINQLWGLQGFDTIVGLIVSIIIANIAGGGGVALIFQGPIGLIVGFIAGLVAFVLGRQLAERQIKEADLYLW
ncbi:MAG: Hsp70 family protein, partial [Pseudomonadota bacterium]|nr:Hsp70 family protein [Pseudomonadota bacterium]